MEIMRILSCDRYISIETALNEAGLKIDEVVKQGKKTVITVCKYANTEKPQVTPQKQADRFIGLNKQ